MWRCVGRGLHAPCVPSLAHVGCSVTWVSPVGSRARVCRTSAAPDVDVWVLALPNGLCAEHAAAITARAASSGSRAPIMIDLSADMRFDATRQWVYGMPERPGARAALRTARMISNPGCYATGAQVCVCVCVCLCVCMGACRGDAACARG